MKKFILFMLTGVFMSSLYSQSLTNRQVYDFSVGDVFITKYESRPMVNNPTSYTKDSILSKRYSDGLDTLSYQVFRIRETLPTQMYEKPTYSYNTFTKDYTKLDQPATHYDQDGRYCIPPTDSLYVHEKFKKRVWNYSVKLYTDSICYEPDYFSSSLIEGYGGPYYSYGSGGDPNRITYYYKLVYSKKDGVEHGINQNFPLGIENLENNKVTIFPNPTTDKVNIAFKKTHQTIAVTVNDIHGKTVLHEIATNKREVNISLKYLTEGVYFIHLQTDETNSMVKVIKK